MMGLATIQVYHPQAKYYLGASKDDQPNYFSIIIQLKLVVDILKGIVFCGKTIHDIYN